MKNLKELKDIAAKAATRGGSANEELKEYGEYFRRFGSITFAFEQVGSKIIARSTDFRQGSIITSARTLEELDDKIKDAILTSFDIPSAYSKEAEIRRLDAVEAKYAAA